LTRLFDWWRGRPPFRLRAFFRGVFLLLALATVALALSVLGEEKRLSYRGYRDLFHKNVEQITARLQHPTGQLALLNPVAPGTARTPLRPLLLPFAAIDFDDRAKAQQAVEMAGCLVQYPDHAQLCVAVGNNPLAGGFIYAVGAFVSGPLTAHAIGDLELSHAHRLRVEVAMRGATDRWLAPLEATSGRTGTVRGRLTGFAEDALGHPSRRPDREFRGWLWQDARCVDGIDTAPGAQDCARRAFFSVRLPITVLREELYANPNPVWPPADLGDIRVRVRVLPPGDAPPLFDSDRGGGAAPFRLDDLASQLLAGETLTIRRLDPDPKELLRLNGSAGGTEAAPRFIGAIVRRLPVEGVDGPLEARATIATPVGNFELRLTGDVRGIDRSLEPVANRLAWFAGAMLAAIALAWLALEIRIIRRITLLTTRAASVRKTVHAGGGLIEHDLANLRGRDELGLLAGVLTDLLQRVNEDVRRAQIRAEQEKDMWHAVGHEILAPLQSLSALHPTAGDPNRRYIERMQQAVRVLYGTASPGEAIRSAALAVSTLDIHGFLTRVADNAAHAGIADVRFGGGTGPLVVRADEHSLEDVITHVLANADRFRPAGTPIRIELAPAIGRVAVHIRNQGPAIDESMLGKIFEYGVSGAPGDGTAGHRGQGLFVAKTYMAKMGGTIEARNLGDGVDFVLTLDAA
jgi:signal transduction histidine kinase